MTDPNRRDPRPQGLSFDDVAEFYDRGRPAYPDQLIDDVIEFCGVKAPRVLEVGAGTGKATRLLGERGLEVVVLEPSAKMAIIARRRCADFPLVSVLITTFEDWPIRGTFDLVVSAQAWHWIAPTVRFQKARAALDPRGRLALFWTHPLWEQVTGRPLLLSAYEQWAPELVERGPWFPGFAGPAGGERPTEEELAGSFGPLDERRYRWVVTYSAESYLQLLQSFPEHEVLSPDRLSALINGIDQAIDVLGGVLEVPYETRLYATIRLDLTSTPPG